MAEDRRGFHFDKTISIGHIISTLTFIIWGITWATSMDKRVEANTLQIQYVSEAQKEDATRIELLRTEIKQDLTQINNKLDRLIESKR